MFTLTKKNIKELNRLLDRPIQETWGSYNKICPQCLGRFGHNLMYCSECGHKTIDFKYIPVPITYREWILKATTEQAKHKRAFALLWITNWKDHPLEKRRVAQEEIIKLVEGEKRSQMYN